MRVFFDDITTAVLQRALTALSLRQQVTSNNLANLNTPGFKASEVLFEAELKRALEAERGQVEPLRVTHPAHFRVDSSSALEVQPIVRTRMNTTLRADGNNVDLEKEMASLTETSLLYQASTQILARKLALLRAIVTEGRK
ncbi:MAG: flagellar basal body rod protein FlgB [Anaerolineae bacterium]|nr:flagellar basal body rod protein FlgB [Anaerolineae bacterium]MDW8099716.1 flagellar basal body rod protein FlgB [Anaerolineae bacterium]